MNLLQSIFSFFVVRVLVVMYSGAMWYVVGAFALGVAAGVGGYHFFG